MRRSTVDIVWSGLQGKVGLEASGSSKSINEIAQEHRVHPAQVGLQKKEDDFLLISAHTRKIL
jgi:hypothetical protein